MSISRTAARMAALSVLVLFAGAASVRAQALPRTFNVSPLAGIYLGGSYDGSGVVPDLDVTSAFLFGIRGEYRFSRQVGLEFEFSHADPEVKIDATEEHLADLSVNHYEGTFNFYWGQPTTQVYMALGAGATDFSADVSGGESRGETKFTGIFGLGVTKWVKENLGLRLDGRYRWTDVNGDDSIYCDPFFGCYDYDTSWYGSGEITGGVTYQF
jgi:outer membrane protein with beta-barrel domain